MGCQTGSSVIMPSLFIGSLVAGCMCRASTPEERGPISCPLRAKLYCYQPRLIFSHYVTFNIATASCSSHPSRVQETRTQRQRACRCQLHPRPPATRVPQCQRSLATSPRNNPTQWRRSPRRPHTMEQGGGRVVNCPRSGRSQEEERAACR